MKIALKKHVSAIIHYDASLKLKLTPLQAMEIIKEMEAQEAAEKARKKAEARAARKDGLTKHAIKAALFCFLMHEIFQVLQPRNATCSQDAITKKDYTVLTVTLKKPYGGGKVLMEYLCAKHVSNLPH